MFLNDIRAVKKGYSIPKQILVTLGILLLGIILGTFSKYLDYRQSELPALLQLIQDNLDISNFLGRFSFWIIIAVCISVYSNTPIIASINVFIFFVGMVSSYYIYCNFVAGFFPMSYAIIWGLFTIVSPLLSFLCWYAKGKGIIALIISAGIFGVMINTAFVYGIFYIDIVSWLDVMMFIISIIVLYKSPKQIICSLMLGVIIAPIIRVILPFNV